MDTIYWTWSKKGEYLEKSRKQVKEMIEASPPETDVQSLEEKIIRHSQENNFIEENKREQSYARLSKRKLMADSRISPFHVKNNYINDISVQDAFLRPKNSNFNVKNKDLNDK